MIEPAVRALPVATTGFAPLFAAGQLPAATTAVLLSAIAGTANKEDCAALQASAKALPQSIVAVWKHVGTRRSVDCWNQRTTKPERAGRQKPPAAMMRLKSRSPGDCSYFYVLK